MADFKKYGQKGVNADLQYGKQGPRLVADTGAGTFQFKDLGGIYVSREELFSTADIVSLHIPNNKETRKCIGENDFQLLTTLFLSNSQGRYEVFP